MNEVNNFNAFRRHVIEGDPRYVIEGDPRSGGVGYDRGGVGYDLHIR